MSIPPKTKVIRFRCSEEEEQICKALAAAEGLTLSEWLRELVEDAHKAAADKAPLFTVPEASRETRSEKRNRRRGDGAPG